MFCGNQVGHGFRLGEVEASVQEGALGEFPWSSLPAARLDEGPHDFLLDEGRAVDVELDGVFPGVRLRAAHDQGEPFIQGVAGGVHEFAKRDRTVGDFSQGLENTLEPSWRAWSPDTRMTAIPPAPGAVEMAQMVAPSTASRRGSSWREFGTKFAAHSQQEATNRRNPTTST